MNLRHLIVTLAVLAASLSACGGDDSSSRPAAGGGATTPTPSSASPSSSDAPAADGDACSLLTTDAVAAAVGSPVKAGIASTGPAVTGGSFTTCLWQSADPANPADTATITLYPNAAAADSARSDDAQDVSGIGDKAYADAFASVWVYVGDQSVFAQWYAFSGTDDDSLPKSESLAKAVADAL